MQLPNDLIVTQFLLMAYLLLSMDFIHGRLSLNMSQFSFSTAIHFETCG